jgi:hypothetical protein
MQLFCSFCATFTLNVLISVSHGDTFGHIRLGSPGLVDFGTFGSVNLTLANFHACVVMHALYNVLY